MNMKRRHLLTLLLPALALVGCNPASGPPGGPPPAPEVLFTLPTEQMVTDSEDFPGRTEAVDSVDLRARVTGYLTGVRFREGADVEKDELLFEIDPLTYKAEEARAQALMTQSQAKFNRVQGDYERMAKLIQDKAASREEFEKISGDLKEANASISVARANLDLAKINVSYTQLRSPIKGRVSRHYIDVGNLVKADDTVLTTIVSLDKMYAYFDLDERTTLRLQKLMREGKIKFNTGKGLEVYMGLVSETGFPRKGHVDFVDNRLDPDSGTWRLRGKFDNTDHVLSPGLFVRVRLPIGEPYKGTLVPEEALGTDQGQKFIYVIDENNKVVYRRVKAGRLLETMRVIEEGVKPGERVIVSGLQRVRQGQEVKPKERVAEK